MQKSTQDNGPKNKGYAVAMASMIDANLKWDGILLLLLLFLVIL